MSGYGKGARLERRVRAELERQGYVVIRSAGSRGPADLVALRKGRRPLLIAVARRGPGREARRRLMQAAQQAGAIPLAASGGRRLTLKRLKDNGQAQPVS